MNLVDIDGCQDVYFLDVDMYDAPQYGGVYIVASERPAIIETGLGTNYERILEAVHAIGISPESIETIAVTHVHLDHAGGAGYLSESCENATVVVHERGARHLVNPERLIAGTKAAVGEQWKYYRKPLPIPEGRIRSVSEGDTIDLGGHRLEVIETPGHAKHQVVYHIPSISAIFTGDAAGIWIPERANVTVTSPPSEFDLEQAIVDVDKLVDIDAEMLLYTHFGAVEASAELLHRYQRKLTDWISSIADTRKKFSDDEQVIEQISNNAPVVTAWGEEKTRAETRLNTRGALAYLDQRGED